MSRTSSRAESAAGNELRREGKLGYLLAKIQGQGHLPTLIYPSIYPSIYKLFFEFWGFWGYEPASTPVNIMNGVCVCSSLDV